MRGESEVFMRTNTDRSTHQRSKRQPRADTERRTWINVPELRATLGDMETSAGSPWRKARWRKNLEQDEKEEEEDTSFKKNNGKYCSDHEWRLHRSPP